MIIFALFITLGEMFFSPLGSSFIAKYAPSRLYATMGSVWGFAIFFAAMGYGYLYNGLFGGSMNFTTACIIVAVVAFIAVILLVVLDKPLTSLVKSSDEEDKENK